MTLATLLRAESIGAGVSALVEHRTTTTARVVGVFSRGCYVRADDGGALFALGTIPAGPVHLVVSGRLAPAVGAPVSIADDHIQVAGIRVELSDAMPWRPALPTSALVAQTIVSLADLDAACPPDLAAVWPGVESALVLGDLDGARQALQGRGGGSTPTGDDVLAGLLLVDAMVRCGSEAERRRISIATTTQTTDLSRAMLQWAARGQSIEPVHHLIDVAAIGDLDRVRTAASAVRRIGASSGAAMLAGLRLGSGWSR